MDQVEELPRVKETVLSKYAVLHRKMLGIPFGRLTGTPTALLVPYGTQLA